MPHVVPKKIYNIDILVLFVNRRTRNTGVEVPVELGTWPGPVTKIRYRCGFAKDPKFVIHVLNLGTRSGVTRFRKYILKYTSTVRLYKLNTSIISVHSRPARRAPMSTKTLNCWVSKFIKFRVSPCGIFRAGKYSLCVLHTLSGRLIEAV